MQLDKETKLKQEKERCRQLAQRVAEEARPASAQVLNSESDLLEKALRRAGIRAEEWSAQAAEPVDLLVVEDPVWSHLPQQLPEKVLLASVDSTMMAAWAEQLARRGYYRDFRWRSKGRAQQSAVYVVRLVYFYGCEQYGHTAGCGYAFCNISFMKMRKASVVQIRGGDNQR